MVGTTLRTSRSGGTSISSLGPNRKTAREVLAYLICGDFVWAGLEACGTNFEVLVYELSGDLVWAGPEACGTNFEILIYKLSGDLVWAGSRVGGMDFEILIYKLSRDSVWACGACVGKLGQIADSIRVKLACPEQVATQKSALEFGIISHVGAGWIHCLLRVEWLQTYCFEV